MKKILALATILALSACSNGSGGGTPPSQSESEAPPATSPATPATFYPATFTQTANNTYPLQCAPGGLPYTQGGVAVSETVITNTCGLTNLYESQGTATAGATYTAAYSPPTIYIYQQRATIHPYFCQPTTFNPQPYACFQNSTTIPATLYTYTTAVNLIYTPYEGYIAISGTTASTLTNTNWTLYSTVAGTININATFNLYPQYTTLATPVLNLTLQEYVGDYQTWYEPTWQWQTDPYATQYQVWVQCGIVSNNVTTNATLITTTATHLNNIQNICYQTKGTNAATVVVYAENDFAVATSAATTYIGF